MNNITIKGRLVRDPELRQTANGVAVCGFTVAVDRNFTPKGEERKSDFFNCNIWRGGAETIAKFFSKGSEIVVSGSMESRNYTDKDGNNRQAWELQVQNFSFCGSRNESKPTVENSTQSISNIENFDLIADEDDLPF